MARNGTMSCYPMSADTNRQGGPGSKPPPGGGVDGVQNQASTGAAGAFFLIDSTHFLALRLSV